MRLESSTVERIFKDCLFRDGEDSTDHVKVEGIILTVGFNPQRLNSHKDEIIQLLDELPDEFKESRGKGWSFLQACNDRRGENWTGLHMIMEELFLLGLAIDKVVSLLPRDMWFVLPGGLPYYMVKK